MELAAECKMTVDLPQKSVDDDITECKRSSLGSHQTLMVESSYFDAYNITAIEDVTETRQCESSVMDEVSTPCVVSYTDSQSESRTSNKTDMIRTEAPPHTVEEPPPKLVKSNSCDSDSDLFDCGICTEDLKTPKSLPCLHNFCQDCLQKYFSANGIEDGQTFQCPTCRAPVSIPSGGARHFPTNFHIVNLRKRGRDLDMGQTIKEALQYLEYRTEEIVDELTERKRQVNVIKINNRWTPNTIIQRKF